MQNHGINISGGTVNAHQMVVGDNASLVINEAQRGPLLDSIEELLREIRRSPLASGQRQQLAQVVEGVRTEANRPQPEKSTLEKGLSAVASVAASMSGVMGALKAAREVAGLFFGV
jgi:hypothetical protein